MTPLVLSAALALSPPAPGALPFGPGERLTLRITYARMLGGRAHLAVEPSEGGGGSWRFVATAKSEGFFAWLFRFRVDDRTVAEWDPERACSLGIEKRLRGHVFQLNLSNGLGTTMAEMARGASSDNDWFLGFNISRKFF